MNFKWQISVLFLLLFLGFGVLQEQNTNPNQEIVLEFITDVDSKNQEATLATITKKLTNLGASNINIKKTNKGTLLISYYSAFDVQKVRKTLLNQENLLVENSNENQPNEEKKSSDYNVDIHEIREVLDFYNPKNNCVLENKESYDRGLPIQTFASLKNTETSTFNLFYKTKLKVKHQPHFYKKTISNGEPEVRAGPFFINFSY